MKKLIGILVAALLVMQSFAVLAYDDVYVDGNLQMSESGKNTYQDTLIISGDDNQVVDYKATLDLKNVRDKYAEYYAAAGDTAKNLGLDQTSVDNAAVSGTIAITITFPKGLTPSDEFIADTNMSGFDGYDTQNGIFVETTKRTSTDNDADGSKVVVLTITVKDGITAKALSDNLAAYLADMNLVCNQVTASGFGSYTVTGEVEGNITISTGDYAQSIRILSREVGTESDAVSAKITFMPSEVEDFEKTEPKDIEFQLPDTLIPETPGTEVQVKQVTVNGNVVPADSFVIQNGKLTFKKEYLETLPVGEYVVEIVTEDDKEATVGLIVSEATVEPTAVPLPTRQPTPYSPGGGGSWGTGATATPKPTTEPNATAEPTVTQAPGTEGLPFVDVAPSDWFVDAVQYVYEHGLMNGTSATTFEPNAPVDRAMFATIIYRIEGSPAATTENMTFTDVPAGEYYTDAVAWCFANGVVTGYSDTEYAPQGKILREQMAALMYRYANFKGIDTSATVAQYTDSDQIDDYAVPAVSYCTAAGLMNGVGDGAFDPQADATRGEVATVVMRLYNSVVTQ